MFQITITGHMGTKKPIVTTLTETNTLKFLKKVKDQHQKFIARKPYGKAPKLTVKIDRVTA